MPEIIIRVKGKLDPAWSDWFDGLSVEGLPGGDTILSGSVPDQPALYGILSRLSSLGISLISCDTRVTTPKPDTQSE